MLSGGDGISTRDFKYIRQYLCTIYQSVLLSRKKRKEKVVMAVINMMDCF